MPKFILHTNGIGIKVNGVQKGFNWLSLSDKTDQVVNGKTVSWKDIKAFLDENNIDLSSSEMQAKIDDQKTAFDEPTLSKEQLKNQAQKEAERIAWKEILQERIEADPYLSAIANVKTKIESGEINENASKAIREELGK